MDDAAPLISTILGDSRKYPYLTTGGILEFRRHGGFLRLEFRRHGGVSILISKGVKELEIRLTMLIAFDDCSTNATPPFGGSWDTSSHWGSWEMATPGNSNPR